MKTILLHIHDDIAMEARFQAALALARQQGAHLTCLQVLPSPYYPAEAAVSPGTYELLVEGIEAPARAQRAALEARLRTEMVPWSWRVRTGALVGHLLAEARLADLIVVSLGEETTALSTVGGLIVHGQLPVLAVPAQASQFDPAGPVMIAWNGSGEAANAVRHALPLLRAASKVHIVSIEEANDGLPSSDLAAYLSRHEIHADVQERRPGSSVEEALVRAAGELGASCIVMGGYGHSRMRELVFGGVTRAMLQDSAVPLLLSH